MRKIAGLVVLLVGTITWHSLSLAEPKITQKVAQDIGQVFGFWLAQTNTLDAISEKYPALAPQAEGAKREFLLTFGASLDAIDAQMLSINKAEWESVKNTLKDQTRISTDMGQVTDAQASQFVDLVRKRANGDIPSPILETLLLFNPDYDQQPAREFIDGYKYTYRNDGSGKAKGVAFSIQAPKTWMAKPGERPNIIQKFVSRNGMGPESLTIIIKEVPLPPGQRITSADVADLLGPNGARGMLPPGAVYVNSGPATLETLPGLWMRARIAMGRLDVSVEAELLLYAFFHGNKMIQLQGHVLKSSNGVLVKDGGFDKYAPVFKLMSNSFVLTGLYK